MPAPTQPLSVNLPAEMRASVDAIAETCARPPEWVVQRAICLYLKGEGAQVLSVTKGREQIARGDVHDMDDVLAELEAPYPGSATP